MLATNIGAGTPREKHSIYLPAPQLNRGGREGHCADGPDRFVASMARSYITSVVLHAVPF
jgi:hypothetical protein